MANILSNIEDENRVAIIVCLIFIFLGIFFYVTFPPLQTAAGIYTLLSVVSLVIYSLNQFQDSVIGINLKRLGLQFLIGIGLATAFILIKIIIPSFAIGTPFLGYSVSTAVTAIIILFFAPFVEEIICRGALLGWISWAKSKGGEVTTLQFWIANSIQALFFAGLHLAAYIAGWYNLPGGASLATDIAAQSSAFIAAFTFGLAAGFIDTRKNVKSILPSILAHLIINTTVFLSLNIVGLNIIPSMSLALVANGIFFIVPVITKERKYKFGL